MSEDGLEQTMRRAGVDGEPTGLLVPALVAHAVAQVAILSRVEPDRDHHRAPFSWRFDGLRVLEGGSNASIRHRLEGSSVTGILGGVTRLVPASNLDMKLLAVVAADPIVDRPPVLGRRREVVCLDQVSHGRPRCMVHRARRSCKDVDRSRDDEAENGKRNEGLHRHGDLRPGDEWHHVGGAERGRIGEPQVEVVDEPRPPVLPTEPWIELRGNARSGRLPMPCARSAAPPPSSSQ